MKPEELRLWMRQRCLDSLYFFNKVIFGYKDMVPHVHLPVCQFLEDMSIRRRLLVLPRGHLKSSVATIGYAAWRATKNPEMRILIANATSTNAEGFLRAISGTLKGSTLYQWLFPELLPDFGSRDVRWNSTGIEFRRRAHWTEATIECIGVGGTAVSRHYDLIIKDDLVNEDHIKTPEMMQKVVEWHKYAESLFIAPGKGEDLVVGTRWAFNDIISHVQDNQPDYVKYVKQVTTNGKNDGPPLWPERFPSADILQILKRQGPKIFSCQYMNDPVHEDTRAFSPEWIRRFDTLPVTPLRFYTAIDPAISQGRGDFSAIVTVAVDSAFNLYVAEAVHGRWGVDELCNKIVQTYSAWQGVIGLETIMFQKALMWPIREAMRRTGVTFTIEPLKPGSKETKEARIASMHPYFANGSLWLRVGLHDLEKELVEFPASAHDDLLDALAYAVQMASPASRTISRPENPFGLDAILKELKDKTHAQPEQWTWHTPYRNVPVQ